MLWSDAWLLLATIYAAREGPASLECGRWLHSTRHSHVRGNGRGLGSSHRQWLFAFLRPRFGPHWEKTLVFYRGVTKARRKGPWRRRRFAEVYWRLWMEPRSQATACECWRVVSCAHSGGVGRVCFDAL